MRNILVVLFISVMGNAALPQAYTPFISADSSDVWKQIKQYSLYAFEPNLYELVYRITGDTLIGSNHYASLSANYFYHWEQQFWGVPPPIWDYGEGYGGAIRETNKQVFFVFTDSAHLDTTEYLIYDFNLNVGDTVPDIMDCWWPELCQTQGNGTPDELVITSLDSILIGGIYRKRFVLANNEWIVEGMGASTGLFNQISGFIAGSSILSCYQEQSATLYSNQSWSFYYSACELDMSINKGIADLELQILPNPVKVGEEIKVVLKSGTNYDIEVFNLLGKNIYTSSEENGIATLSIDLNMGVYLIRISTSNGQAVQKLVVH